MTVARTLGGSLVARNLPAPERGAEVVIQLPLAAISLPDPGATAHHGRH